MDDEVIRKKLYSMAEDRAHGWNRWTPNAAWKNGFEQGVDEALELVKSARAEARAEALMEAAERAEGIRTEWMAKHLSTWREYDAGYTTGLAQLAAILEGEPKEEDHDKYVYDDAKPKGENNA